MEVVVVVNVQAPAANVRDVNVEALHSDRPGLPDGRRAGGVLVADRHFGHGHAVHLLLVNVAFVPRESVREVWIGLERFIVHGALDDNSDVDETKSGRDHVVGEAHQGDGHVARRLAAVVHQVHAGAGDGNALLQNLQKNSMTIFVIFFLNFELDCYFFVFLEMGIRDIFGPSSRLIRIYFLSNSQLKQVPNIEYFLTCGMRSFWFSRKHSLTRQSLRNNHAINPVRLRPLL